MDNLHASLPDPATSQHSALGTQHSALSTQHSAHRWLNVGFAAVLFLLIWLAYQPSLAHMPRSDQYCFLLDTLEQQGFVETFLHTYSYNRTREVEPGDYHLFRPVLFALLSAERAWCGDNFAALQWVGIVLHFLAVYLALQVMLHARRLLAPDAEEPGASEGWFTERSLLRVLPYGLALFFGLNFAVMEMVIWSHINGYLLAVVFLQGALLLLLHYWTSPATPTWWRILLLAGTWLLLLLAAFTHELGQFFAVVFGFTLAVSQRGEGRRRRLVLFALFAGLLVLYQAANLLDQKAHPDVRPDIKLSAVVKRGVSFRSTRHAARYVLYTTFQPFFPSCATWSFSPPLRLDIPEPRAIRENYSKGGPVLVTSYLVAASALVLAGRGFLHLLRGRRRGDTLLVLLLPAALFGSHLALTVFGRMNMRPGSGILSSNSYYTYLPLLGFLIGLYVLWVSVLADAGRTTSPLVRSLYVTFLAGLVGLSLYSGKKVCAINTAVKKDRRPLHAGMQWLADFVRQHREEPDFSFAFDLASYDDMEIWHGIPLPVILFKRHLNNLSPKYLVTLRGNQRSAVRYCGGRQVFPELVRVGSPFNFFYYEGRYYGVRSADGYYRPDRGGYHYLITDRTLEGACSQVRRKLDEEAADRGSAK